jgi:hypothetical protein
MKKESNMLVDLIIILLMLILTSCTKTEKNYTVKEVDGIKVFRNKNIPSDSTFTITPKEVFKIQGYNENAIDTLRNFVFPRSTTVDSKGNIFILDQTLSQIKKFDKNGKFIKSFCNMGTGPGELRAGIGLICLSDTLYVQEVSTLQHLKFTTNG